MLESQADRLVMRLKGACTYHRFDEPGVYAEYIKFLMRHDFDRMDAAVDAAIEDDSRNVPAISVLAKKYKEVSKNPEKAIIKNDEYCAVCDDKGYIMMREKQPDTGIEYEYVLYCPFCAVGRSQAYDGSQCKDHKSPYRVPPLTEYFGDEGIQALREANLKRRATKTEKTRQLEKEIQTVGKSMPDGWQYDVEIPF